MIARSAGTVCSVSAVRTTSPSRLIKLVRGGVNDVLGRGPVFAPQPLGRHIDPSDVRGYYCDMRHKAQQHTRHPDYWLEYVIPTAQTALGYWELMLDGGDTREPFLDRAESLVRQARPGPGGRGVAWYTDRPLTKYDLAPGWISAMGQGEAISVLLRAHSLTGNERYLGLANEAFEPFDLDVAEGGVQRCIDGHVVLEEYATAKPAAILNGWIFALFGVHELATTTGHERARRLFDQTFDGLVSLLPRYDVGWWSRYSLYDHGRPDLAKPFYQRLHPVLLTAVDMIRPNPALRIMADRWRRQLNRRGVARLLVDKLAFRLHWERNVVDGAAATFNPTG